jgi:hypothetical protein
MEALIAELKQEHYGLDVALAAMRKEMLDLIDTILYFASKVSGQRATAEAVIVEQLKCVLAKRDHLIVSLDILHRKRRELKQMIPFVSMTAAEILGAEPWPRAVFNIEEEVFCNEVNDLEEELEKSRPRWQAPIHIKMRTMFKYTQACHNKYWCVTDLIDCDLKAPMQPAVPLCLEQLAHALRVRTSLADIHKVLDTVTAVLERCM